MSLPCPIYSPETTSQKTSYVMPDNRGIVALVVNTTRASWASLKGTNPGVSFDFVLSTYGYQVVLLCIGSQISLPWVHTPNLSQWCTDLGSDLCEFTQSTWDSLQICSASSGY